MRRRPYAANRLFRSFPSGQNLAPEKTFGASITSQARPTGRAFLFGVLRLLRAFLFLALEIVCRAGGLCAIDHNQRRTRKAGAEYESDH